MSAVTYQELIKKSFRDNAIRSVMLIDDDFLPYDELVNLEGNFSSLGETTKKGIKFAAKIHNFFQEKKILCDVDRNTDHVIEEKVRKCDLVILDYHLENNSPKKSLETIRGLSATEHLNLVLVYTNEDLDKVWKQVAVSLCGSIPNEKIPGSLEQNDIDKWNDITEYGSIKPEIFLNEISEDDLVQFLCSGEVTGRTKGILAREFRSRKDVFANIFCSIRLNELNVLGIENTGTFVDGKNSEKIKWLQKDNVFVVFKKKAVDINEFIPQEIWDEIGNALIDWDPTYYQILISEIQNQIENEPMSFDSNFLYDQEGQAGWLYQILQEIDTEKQKREINRLVSYLADELEFKLNRSDQLRSFASQIFSSLNNNDNQELVHFCTSHCKVSKDGALKNRIGHAVNHSLSSIPFSSDFITNGTILVETDNPTNIYLCVTPACETVQFQYTGGQLIKHLRPHRLLKFLVLKPIDLTTALEKATHSNYIFLKIGHDRNAYSTLNLQTSHPEIQYILIKNHDSTTRERCMTGIEGATFSEESEGQINNLRTYKAVAQLRESYAARFQSIASHHLGRIGVDFVNFSDAQT